MKRLRNQIKIYLSLILLGICLFAYAHPFYVSIVNIVYSSSKKTIEISARIFYDDLEMALNHDGNTNLNILKPQRKESIDSAIAAYSKKYLKVSANGTTQGLKYIGYEIEDEVAWCYFEIPQLQPLKKLEISNRMLYNNFKNQSHIFHVTVDGLRQSMKIDNPKSFVKMEF